VSRATPGRDTDDRADPVPAFGFWHLVRCANLPVRTPATKAFHWAELNVRTAPWTFLLSRTAMRLSAGA
jgi:hypothetical protein